VGREGGGESHVHANCGGLGTTGLWWKGGKVYGREQLRASVRRKKEKKKQGSGGRGRQNRVSSCRGESMTGIRDKNKGGGVTPLEKKKGLSPFLVGKGKRKRGVLENQKSRWPRPKKKKQKKKKKKTPELWSKKRKG